MWEPSPVQIGSRRLESREVSVAIRFARFGRVAYPGASLPFRQLASSACCTRRDSSESRLADAHPSTRALSHARGASYRDVPTSDVLVASQARLEGSKPARRCRPYPSRSTSGFTCSARSASRTPRKERTSVEPGRLKPYREIPTELSSSLYRNPALRVVWEDSAQHLRTRSPCFYRRPRQCLADS